ncbi:DUF3261 domain-containing protein [Gallibacterium trehalosifermentans]|uniref:DUF3261 domain-containing protein n=1 Tax=Gallibacterium trehalosifermentans TaxID=516935 RepID=A0ABV6H097_9PAST
MQYFRFICCALTIFLCGCQLSTNNTQYHLQKTTQVPLPSLSFAPTIEAQQLLHINAQQMKPSNHHLLTLLALSPERLSLTLLSPVGIRLAQLEYNGQTINVKQQVNLANNNLPPLPQIVGDILLTTLPLTAWQSVLPVGWQISDQDKQRVVLNDKGQAVVRVDYGDDAYQQAKQITHYQFHYQILLEHLE